MKVINQGYIKVLFIICVVFEVGIIFFDEVVYPDGKVWTYGNFLIEIAVFAYAVFLSKFRLKLSSKDIILISVFLISQLMMFLYTSLRYDIPHFDMHKLFMCVGVIYACYYMAHKVECPPTVLNWIFNVTLCIGVIATIYNFFNNVSIFSMGDISQIMHYTWGFRAFFQGRAIYGSFLVICALITLFKLEQRDKFSFIVLYFWFVGNIIITTARAQCLALVIGSAIYMLYTKKYRKYVVFGIVIILIYVVFSGISYFENVIDTYYMFFDHSRGKKTDITTGRLELWAIALNHMDVLNWIAGNGLGGRDAVLSMLDVKILGNEMLSFHSGYIDLLFDTGILGIYIWIRYIRKVIYCVRVSCPLHFKHFFWATLAAVGTLWCFDSVCLIFTTDILSMPATFFLIALPLSVANYYKNLGR